MELDMQAFRDMVEFRAMRSSAFNALQWIKEEYLAAPPPAVGFGVRGLDAVVPFGLEPGVHVIQAEPGVGKSALALHACLMAALNSEVRAAFLSLEMDAATCWVRCASEASSMGETGLRDRFSFSERQYFRRKTSVDGLSYEAATGGADPLATALRWTWEHATGLLITDDPRLHDRMQLAAYVVHLSQVGVGLVAVDYLQLVEGLRGEDVYRSTTETMHALAAAANECGVAVLLVSSLNRSAASGPLRGGSGSSAIEYDATTLIRLSRETDEHGNELPPVPGTGAVKVVAKIAKNRQGRSGDEIELDYVPKWNRWMA